MKRLGTSLLVLPLVVAVLLGSGGFTIGKMICGGNECASSYSFGAAKDCCDPGSEQKETFSKDCCCEIINVSYALDDFSLSEKVSVSAQQLHLFYLPTAYCQLPAFLFSNPLHTFADASPPFTTDPLYLIRSLLL